MKIIVPASLLPPQPTIVTMTFENASDLQDILELSLSIICLMDLQIRGEHPKPVWENTLKQLDQLKIFLGQGRE